VKRRPIWLSLVLIVVTVAIGLTLRMAPLGLPRFVMKYGGSTMWALMIYWLVTTLLPSVRISAGAVLAGVIATAVEFFKLYRSPAVDAFRTTLAGTLLLGRHFSMKDILAYWIAIAAGFVFDAKLRGSFGSTQ
jgi:hypothetical protein